jgi:transcriptional regulator with XRE-family HTH domain
MLKIKELRNQKKVTQKDLAAHLGITNRTLYDYESGKLEISFNNLKKIAKFLDVDFATLAGETLLTDQQKEIDLLKDDNIKNLKQLLQHERERNQRLQEEINQLKQL